MHRSFAALALAVAATVGLAACTPSPTPAPPGTSTPQAGPDGPGDAGQSVADACALIQDTIAEATQEFENASGGDPRTVVETMRAAAGKLGGAASTITNDEVAALLPALQQMYRQAADVMEGIVSGQLDQANRLSELASTFRETTERYRDVCG